MDKLKRITLLSFILLLCLSFGSCRQAAKKLVKETAEEGAEAVAERGASRMARELGEEMIEQDAKQFIKRLASEDKLFKETWEALPDVLRKSTEDVLQRDPRLRSVLVSNATSFFSELQARGSKNLMKSPDLVAFFAEGFKRSERNYGFNPLRALEFMDDGRGVKIFTHVSGKKQVLGEMKDGILSMHLMDDAEDLFRQPLLKGGLIPNTSYKIKTVGGELKYTVRTDALGRVSSLEGTGLSKHQLEQNVLRFREGVNFSPKGRIGSSGSKVDVKVRYTYTKGSEVPEVANVRLKDGKKTVNDVISNKSVAKEVNSLPLADVVKRQGLPAKEQQKLLKECEQNPRLRDLIHQDPATTVQRWRNTRNHVDKSLVARTPSGKLVPNASYAGNTYYFEPALNAKLADRLKRGGGYINLDGTNRLSVEDLIKLDKQFPEGIPFSKSGFPDFGAVAYKRGGKNVSFDLAEFKDLSNRAADFNKAHKLFRAKYGFDAPKGYTWHHLENSRTVILVRTDVHQAVRHAGGVSTQATKAATKKLPQAAGLKAAA